jgi:hypothetical protein
MKTILINKYNGMKYEFNNKSEIRNFVSKQVSGTTKQFISLENKTISQMLDMVYEYRLQPKVEVK